MSKPLIGITADEDSITNSRGALERRYFLKRAVADAVALAGGQPVIVPFCRAAGEAKRMVKRLDGLLISGGNFDIAPSFYGEKKTARCGAVNAERSDSELLLLDAAIKAGIAVLGICGGAQLINVHFGGTLYQDIPSQMRGALAHSQEKPHHHASHPVRVAGESLLFRITGKSRLTVNSTHHQSVKKLGKGLIVGAVASDGVIEAVETARKGKFMLGVQWHPEFLMNAEHRSLFRAFVKAAER